MTQRDHLAERGAAVAAYLSAMQSAGECVTNACPGVGEPFGQRILRLKGRLAFDPTTETIRESSSVLAAELKDFAVLASAHHQRLGIEIRRSVAAVERGVDELEQRTHSFASLMLRLDPATNSALRANLRQFTQEVSTVLQTLREEAQSVEGRLLEGTGTDLVTGLMNRDEAMRRMELLRANDSTHTVVVLELSNEEGGAIPLAALRQVAAKLAMQFRHQDLLASWTEKEFLVVFQGISSLALARCRQAVDEVAGRYHTPTGESVDIAVAIRMDKPEAAAA